MNMKSLIPTVITLLCMAFLPVVQAAESGVSYTRIVSGPDGESWFEEGEFAYNILELGEFDAGLIRIRSAVFAFRFSVVIYNRGRRPF